MTEGGWPHWLRPLRPDEAASDRLRRRIAGAAAPLLADRREEWWDVAGRWSRMLIPIAAGLAIAFAGVAAGAGQEEAAAARSAEDPATNVVEVLHPEGWPAGLVAWGAPGEDVVFAAMGAAFSAGSGEEALPPASSRGP